MYLQFLVIWDTHPPKKILKKKKVQRVGFGEGIDQKLHLFLGCRRGPGGAFLWGGTGPDLNAPSSDPPGSPEEAAAFLGLA